MNPQQLLIDFEKWAFHLEYPAQRWMWSAIYLVLGYIVGLIISRILRFSARRIAGLGKAGKKGQEVKTADHVMIDVLTMLVRASFMLVALALAANLLVGYNLNEARSLAISAGKGLAILVAVWFLGSWLGGRVRKFGDRVAGRTHKGGETLFHFLAALVRFGAFAIGLIAALQQFGFPIASLVAVIGAMGLAIALALQDTLKSVAAGVVIAIFRPYRIGDAVRVAGEEGTVADITPFTTVLNTIDNREVIITNDKIWGDVMVNLSSRDLRRLDLMFSVAYEDNLDQAMRVMTQTFAADHRVRQEPPIWCKVSQLSASSVDIRIRAWCASHDFVDLRGDMLKQVKQAFDREGITIPYPHQVAVMPAAARSSDTSATQPASGPGAPEGSPRS
jgi:small-conductance mechanosensitive channel